MALVVVAFAAWVREPGDHVMAVGITVSSDGKGATDAYAIRRWFPGSRSASVVERAEIDLGQWAGELIRVEIRGGVEGRDAPLRPAGQVGVRAEVVSAGHRVPVEFGGWRNDDSLPFHLSPAGSPAMVAPREGNPPFVYGEGSRLWHVLRAPEDGLLRIELTPVLAGEFDGEPRCLPPMAGPEKKPVRRLAQRGGERRPDVFIYLIDALRADHVSCYGYARETSPNIDAFARGAVLYEEAHAAATWTRPSVATLLTGLYPSVHGVVHDGEDRLAEWPVLLSEALHDAGYATYGISTNDNVSEWCGFNQGFDGFEFGEGESSEWVNAVGADFLSEAPPGRPVFMYAHTMEPHTGYEPERESFRRFDRGFLDEGEGMRGDLVEEVRPIRPDLSADEVGHLVDLYDAEIYDNDRGFKGFLELLKRTGRFENSLIIVVADHGEAFADHGTLEHGHTLNQEEMHVPLILRPPGGKPAGVRVKERVSLVDVYPTVLAAANCAPALGYPLAGRDLLEVAAASPSAASRRAYAEVSMLDSNELDLAAVIDEDGYKRVVDLSVVPGGRATEESVGLWDTRADPKEEMDLTDSLPVRAAYGEQLIAKWLRVQRNWLGAESRGAARLELSEEMEENLRALGYLE